MYNVKLSLVQARGVASDVWNSLAQSTKDNYVRALKKWVEFTVISGISIVNPTVESIMAFI